MLPTSPEMPGAAAGKRVLEALHADERPSSASGPTRTRSSRFEIGERFAAAINADPPEIIEGASHFLQEDAGEQIGRRIADWLGRRLSGVPSSREASAARRNRADAGDLSELLDRAGRQAATSAAAVRVSSSQVTIPGQ